MLSARHTSSTQETIALLNLSSTARAPERHGNSHPARV